MVERLQRIGALLVGALTIAAATAACDGITALDPCSREGACEVRGGYDLALSNFGHTQPLVTIGGVLEVSYTIRNRGDQRSPAATLQLEVCELFCLSPGRDYTAAPPNIPPLEPGESATGTFAVQVAAAIRGVYSVNARIAPGEQRQTGDVEHSNDGGKTSEFRIELPDLTVTVGTVPAEILAGTLLRVEITVRNEAKVTGAPSSVTVPCVIRAHSQVCVSGIEPLRLQTPSLGPGQSRTDTVSLPVPLGSPADQRVAYRVKACADADDKIPQERGDDCATTAPFEALPNLVAACNGRSIAPGQTLSGMLESADCDLAVGMDADVYVFEAAPGASYTADATSGELECVSLNLHNRRGDKITEGSSCSSTAATLRATLVNGGTYYLTVTSFALFGSRFGSYQVSLRRE